MANSQPIDSTDAVPTAQNVTPAGSACEQDPPEIAQRIEIVQRAYPHLPEPVTRGMVERVSAGALGARIHALECALNNLELLAITESLGGANGQVLKALLAHMVFRLQDLQSTLEILREKPL